MKSLNAANDRVNAGPDEGPASDGSAPAPDAATRSVVALTREALRDGHLERMVAQAAPALRLLTEAERARSLRDVLARRPDRGEGVWLFGYGSLIWNPTVEVAERRPAVVHGWHRAFCLSIRAGRGSPDNPGLVLALDRGGACTGLGLRIPEATLEEELTLLWRREMLSGSYVPRWVRLRGAGPGAADRRGFGWAIAFTMDRRSDSYAGALGEDEIVRRLATAHGMLGSAAEYLFRTRDGLHAHGLRDRRVEHLARRVAHALRSDEALPPA